MTAEYLDGRPLGPDELDTIRRELEVMDTIRGKGPAAAAGALADAAGGPDRTRTCDLRFRKPLLYPAELRDHV